MKCLMGFRATAIIGVMSLPLFAAPTIDPLPEVSLPAGTSLTLPVTASSPNGRPLTYTAISSTNRVTVQIRTNNPFWRVRVTQIAPPGSPGAYATTFRGATVLVTNVGDMDFLLFRDQAPRAVDAFIGFSHAGFFDRHTIFHRVIPDFMIQGGDPATNGTGGPVFRYDDEFHPQAMFTGDGQLALANSDRDVNGSQFFITMGPQRHLDFKHTIFGQLLRGQALPAHIANTPRDENDRPLREMIIQQAGLVTNFTDTALTLTGTNLPGVRATIRVIADDGAGGRATNTFTVQTVANTHNAEPFIDPHTVTNLVAPVNGRLTNYFSARDLDGDVYHWFPQFGDQASFNNASNSSYNILPNGQLELFLVPASNFTGVIHMYGIVSSSPLWEYLPNFLPYDAQAYRFVFGDTPITAHPARLTATPGQSFTHQVVATFTNGVPHSPAGNFTATINWGDNVISPGTITTNASGHKEVRGSHTYAYPGEYPVQVTIRSTVGAEAVVTATAVVPPALRLVHGSHPPQLAWPSWAAGYQLQTHTQLDAPDWSPVTIQPALMNDDCVVTPDAGSGNGFFRLKR